MTVATLHADELPLSRTMVRELLVNQFPAWANLPLKPLASSGTDHVMFRLGGELTVRLPRAAGAALQVEKEHRWLGWLGPQLPLPIPSVLGMGRPTDAYPHPWSVYGWLPGMALEEAESVDQHDLASRLGGFVATLRSLDATDGPPSGTHNFGRGVPLEARDAATRQALRELDGVVDTSALLSAWEAALAAPTWGAPPAWMHGDLQAGNLLVRDGRLSAVIDFGGLGVGDPACDLAVAWSTLAPEVRDIFRDAAGLDAAAWARGRGWALSVAAIALPYYLSSSPRIAAASRRTLAAVLADHAARRI